MSLSSAYPTNSAGTAFVRDTKGVLGPLVIGTIFNAVVYGICLLQFTHYWEHKSTDSINLKLLVGWTFCLDTFHTCALIYMLWVYSVEHFNDPNFLITALWPFSATPIVTALTSFPIQIYLSWRIKQFSKSVRAFVGLVILASAQASLGIACSLSAFQNSNLETYSRLTPLVDAWQVLAVAADGSLTVFLWIYLSKSRTGQKRSDNVISRVIYTSVETAAVGAVFCIMDLITFTTLKQSNIHVIFAFPMGRIYTNTLLITLNSRSSLRAEFERPLISDIRLDQSQHANTLRQNRPTRMVNWDQDPLNSVAVSVNIINSANLSPSEIHAISTNMLGLTDVEAGRRILEKEGKVPGVGPPDFI